MTAQNLDEELIRRLANLLGETGLSELEIEQDNKRIRVARQISIAAATPVVQAATAPAQAAAPASISAVNPADHPGAVKSPMVGTAYGSPEPGAAAFVKIGDRVTKGQTLLIVEAMKVMNPIPAPNAGVVKDILFKDGQPVEFGEALVIIE